MRLLRPRARRGSPEPARSQRLRCVPGRPHRPPRPSAPVATQTQTRPPSSRRAAPIEAAASPSAMTPASTTPTTSHSADTSEIFTFARSTNFPSRATTVAASSRGTSARISSAPGQHQPKHGNRPPLRVVQPRQHRPIGRQARHVVRHLTLQKLNGIRALHAHDPHVHEAGLARLQFPLASALFFHRFQMVLGAENLAHSRAMQNPAETRSPVDNDVDLPSQGERSLSQAPRRSPVLIPHQRRRPRHVKSAGRPARSPRATGTGNARAAASTSERLKRARGGTDKCNGHHRGSTDA